MGDVYLECQQYQQALDEYDLSTRFAHEAAVRSLEVYNLVKVGECYYQQQDLTQAFNFAGQAREIAAETGGAGEAWPKDRPAAAARNMTAARPMASRLFAMHSALLSICGSVCCSPITGFIPEPRTLSYRILIIDQRKIQTPAA
jgi:tetratricopeptide (TPR) repeat protein